jgi:quinol monooxygenase YgiN
VLAPPARTRRSLDSGYALDFLRWASVTSLHPHNLQETVMSIVRLIFVKVSAADVAEAERLWKQECAPLMIKQKGCLSEELLKSIDSPGEFISYAVWENQKAIDRYLASNDHQEIKKHARGLKSTNVPEVKAYTLV